MDVPSPIQFEYLPFDYFNRECSETILFIHGAFGTSSDWDLVTPHLSEYHLLLPDLPSHGRAGHMKPFSLEYAAHLLVGLIETQAHGRKAHIVGHSLGASVAIRLASQYPECIRSVLVSGCCKLPQSWFSPYLPYAVWLDQRLEYAVPRPLTRWLMDGTDLQRPKLSLVTMDLSRQIFVDSLSGNAEKWPDSWPAETLIVAATKRGIIPSNDSVEVARKMAEIGREQNLKTYAVEHPAMRHPWPRQDPVLFAELVKAWIRGKPLPDGFKPI